MDGLSPETNLLDIGATSVQLVRIAKLVKKEWGLRLNMNEFVFQTLGQLASSCAEKIHLKKRPNKTGFIRKLWRLIFGRHARTAECE
ncbi:MAG: acyl carrier protein [Deltaproteobacteria bacterium]|nr:acyl carrier protein [Deltaproteobacteria bacterium]